MPFLPQILVALIPLLVPVVLAGVKGVTSRFPKWLLPVLAPVIGGLLDAGLAALGMVSVGPVWGAVLGAAGVAVREIVDQIKKALG